MTAKFYIIKSNKPFVFSAKTWRDARNIATKHGCNAVVKVNNSCPEGFVSCATIWTHNRHIAMFLEKGKWVLRS